MTVFEFTNKSVYRYENVDGESEIYCNRHIPGQHGLEPLAGACKYSTLVSVVEYGKLFAVSRAVSSVGRATDF